ncbi:MAG: hypothetical protein ACKO1M_12185 [Planctomycetota bacterium]
MSFALSAVPAWAALLPLGGYLLMLGCLHLRRRPTVLSGGLDVVALAAGLSGFVLAGPLALLQPAVGTAAWASLMMLGALVLIVAGGLLATRPRLVIYNVTAEQLRPVMAEVVGRLDASARWAGESVVMPARGLQVLMDGRGLARCVSIAAVGTRASPEAWSEFARLVRRGARGLRVRRNAWGAAFAAVGVGCIAGGLAGAVIGRLRSGEPAATVSAGCPPVFFSSVEFRHASARRSFSA